MTPKSVTVKLPAFTAMSPAAGGTPEGSTPAEPPLKMPLPVPAIRAEPVAVTETLPPWPTKVLLLIVPPPRMLRSRTVIAMSPPGAGPKALVPMLARSSTASDWAESVTAPPFAVDSDDSARLTIPLPSPVMVTGPVAVTVMSPPAPAGAANAAAWLAIRAPPVSVSRPTSMTTSAPRPPPAAMLSMNANSCICRPSARIRTSPASPDWADIAWSPALPVMTMSPVASSAIATSGPLVLALLRR